MQDLTVATWNVAAINNNPFEYWVTYPDETYNTFMQGVQEVLNDKDNDVVLHTIFTDTMFADLIDEMQKQDYQKLNLLSEIWSNDYRERYAIHGFLKDSKLGEKRLASMPDRITNTINCKNGNILRRPTVINAYDEGSLSSRDVWWSKWRIFMFQTHVQVFSRDNRDTEPQLVCNLISPILRTKYPAITVHEQEMSVPLQLLCLAILDAIFLHIVNRVDPSGWETIRATLSQSLIHGKDDRICSILAESYLDRSVIFIQEASAALVRKLVHHAELADRYALLLPADFDGKRDQNSVILVDRRSFSPADCTDVTQQARRLPAARPGASPALRAARRTRRRRFAGLSGHSAASRRGRRFAAFPQEVKKSGTQVFSRTRQESGSAADRDRTRDPAARSPHRAQSFRRARQGAAISDSILAAATSNNRIVLYAVVYMNLILPRPAVFKIAATGGSVSPHARTAERLREETRAPGAPE